jgi:hypothetical protein
MAPETMGNGPVPHDNSAASRLDRGGEPDGDWRFGGRQERPPHQRLTEATRLGYQDERLPIQRLLDAQGFLKELAPIHQRRKVWEAWKLAHGLRYEARSDTTPFGLDADAAASLIQDENIRCVRPLSQGDERAREAAECVDRLFETESAEQRARLLSLLGLTFDGLRTTSMRRQLVDVLGTHLIGLDDDPQVGYTGQRLTQHERVAAAGALRSTHSPHVLYYLEKFAESSGRTYQFHLAKGIAQFGTVAVVREAVVRAVAGILDDLDRSTYFAARTETWRMREFATDVGKLYRRLLHLNAHLNTDRNSSWNALRHRRRLPLPIEAQRLPLSVQRLCSQLTSLTDHELSLLSSLLNDLSATPADGQSSEDKPASYVEQTLLLVGRLRSLEGKAWSELQRRLLSNPDWSVPRRDVPDLYLETSLRDRVADESRPAPPAPKQRPSLWGERQVQDLKQVLEQAQALAAPPTNMDAASAVNRQRKAIGVIGAILNQHRAVACVWTALMDECQRVRRNAASSAAEEAVEQFRQHVQSAGGPGWYFQVEGRPARDPERIVYETAARLLAAVARSRRTTLAASMKQLAGAHIAELRDRALDPTERAQSSDASKPSDVDLAIEEQLRRQILDTVSEIV